MHIARRLLPLLALPAIALAQDAAPPDPTGTVLADALAAAAPVRVVLLRRDAAGDAVDAAERARAAGARILVVSAAEIARLCGGGGTADVLAMSGADPGATLDDAFRADGPAWLLVDLAYPGNIGLSIRTAEVSGAAAVAIAPPLAGAARRAALRASIGAHRFFPVHWTTADAALAAARAAGRRIVALESSGTAAPWDVDLRGRILLVAGGVAAEEHHAYRRRRREGVSEGGGSEVTCTHRAGDGVQRGGRSSEGDGAAGDREANGTATGPQCCRGRC